MANGFSPQAEFTQGVGCANSYCHGGGRNDVGTIALTETGLGCGSCHPDITGDATTWGRMSGFHSLHLASIAEEMTCRDCHNAVTADNASIANLTLHINDQRDIAFSDPLLNFDSETLTCNGSCHDKTHPNYTWIGGGEGGRYHPEGFAEPEQHGVEMVLQRSDCRTCHGTDLSGGIGDSCDQCHGADGGAYRPAASADARSGRHEDPHRRA